METGRGQSADLGIYFVNADVIPEPSINGQRAGAEANHSESPARIGQGFYGEPNPAFLTVISRRPGGLLGINKLESMGDAAVLQQKKMLLRVGLMVLVPGQHSKKVS